MPKQTTGAEMSPCQVRRVALVGSFPPRHCGIATHTADLLNAMRNVDAAPEVTVFPIVAHAAAMTRYDAPRLIVQHDPSSYVALADWLNAAPFDLVCLQHEFNLFGGVAGDFVLALLQRLRVPVVTICHTVYQHPSSQQLEVLERVAHLSACLIVMSETGRTFLQRFYSVPPEKVHVVPHGIPRPTGADPLQVKARLEIPAKRMLFTFGLLHPMKGIEYAIEALPALVARHPNLVYLIAGRTHPAVVQQSGERYRQYLQGLAEARGVAAHVKFIDRFIAERELKEMLEAADVYLTPYATAEYITSGTLAWAVGLGKAIVSTPYWYARELLGEQRGILVPFNDASALAEGVERCLSDQQYTSGMQRRALTLGKQMQWPQVAAAVLQIWRLACAAARDEPALHFFAKPNTPRNSSDVTADVRGLRS